MLSIAIEVINFLVAVIDRDMLLKEYLIGPIFSLIPVHYTHGYENQLLSFMGLYLLDHFFTFLNHIGINTEIYKSMARGCLGNLGTVNQALHESVSCCDKYKRR